MKKITLGPGLIQLALDGALFTIMKRLQVRTSKPEVIQFLNIAIILANSTNTYWQSQRGTGHPDPSEKSQKYRVS